MSPIKNDMKDDFRKGALRNEKCPRCGIKLKKCRCGIGDPRAEVRRLMEERRDAIEEFKEEQLKERLEEINKFTDDFVKDKEEKKDD